jgi:hypothetical protein
MGTKKASCDAERLRRLLRSRRDLDHAADGASQPSPLDVDLVNETVAGFETYPTDEHRVAWHPPRWQEAFSGASGRDLLHQVERVTAHHAPVDGHAWISRADVFELAAQGDPEVAFLAAMIFGFGPIGYGGTRTRKIVDAAGIKGVAAAFEAHRHAARDSDVPRDWRAVWEPGGTGKLQDVGPAFGSKLAYFAGFNRTANRGPLIVDTNTSNALWAIFGIQGSLKTYAGYDAYVQKANELAVETASRPDDIERALFELGRALRVADKSTS